MKEYTGPGALSKLASIVKELLNRKQDKLTGGAGQIVGFDEQGAAVAQASAGRSAAGKAVQPVQDSTVTAAEGAEVFNDFRARTFDSAGFPAQGNVASSTYSHAEGAKTTASGDSSHAEGVKTLASGAAAHAEGGASSGKSGSTASGYAAHAEGVSTSASGYCAHAEGLETTASSECTHAEGWLAKATGFRSHAEGYATVASGSNAHAGGYITQASALNSFAYGRNVTASCPGGAAFGVFNKIIEDTVSVLTVGGGTADNARMNCLRVTPSGVFGAGSYNASGADYAELFEWADGNPDSADRAGRFVTLDGEKLRLARPEDPFVLGIVSGDPSVVGDVYDDQWSGMFLRDIFGRTIMEMRDFPEETGPGGETLIPARAELVPKLNPDYDHTQKYTPRTQRPEWDAVGLMGKLVAVDDGTCQINGWCAVGEGGIATTSIKRTRYRVMARLDDTHIRVLIL